MATTSQPQSRPTAPPLPSTSHPVEKAMEPDHGYNVDQAEREKLRAERISRLEGEDPPINEQMARSREIETIGVEEWKRLQDQRPIEEQPIIVKNYIAGGDVLNTPIEGGSQKRVPGITHPIAETPQKAPVRNPDGSLPRA